MTPTPTQAAILAAALQHTQHLVTPPARLAPAPRDTIRRSLLAKGLIEPAMLEQLDENTAWTVNGVPCTTAYPRQACALLSGPPTRAPRQKPRDGATGA